MHGTKGPVNNENKQVELKNSKRFFCAALTHNGPAIKAFCVAERMKAGAEKLNRGKALVHSRNEQPMARFLPSSCKFFEFYECRGTRLIESKLVITL